MKLAILGASGSIGRSTLDVIRAFPSKLELVGVSVHTNIEFVQRMVKEFSSLSYVCFTGLLDSNHVNIPNVNLYFGKNSLVQMVLDSGAEMVIFAIPGGGVVDVFLDLFDLDIKIAMANKEVMVMAHDLIRPGIEKGIRPIDSEQSALWQILPKGLKEVEKVILTCSGGPFWMRKRDELRNVRPEQAIRHPKWSMGPKVSLDSATLMNKALEIIETSALFGIDETNISVLIHPQALTHAMVKFKDGSILSQIGPTDMRLPIQYAISYPERWASSINELDFCNTIMEFFTPDEETFTSLQIARMALRKGGSTLVVFNTSNDLLGEKFFAGEIGFLDIMDVSRQLVELHNPWEISSREDIKRAIHWTMEALDGFLQTS